MPNYRVLVRYISFDEITIKADDSDEAKLIAKRMWDNDEGDWSEANFDGDYDVLITESFDDY